MRNYFIIFTIKITWLSILNNLNQEKLFNSGKTFNFLRILKMN